MAEARRMIAAHAQAELSGVPLDELLGAREAARSSGSADDAGLTRRSLLLGGAGALAGAALASRPARSLAKAAAPAGPRVAIVGAGLAGLRCAHMLWTEAQGGPSAVQGAGRPLAPVGWAASLRAASCLLGCPRCKTAAPQRAGETRVFRRYSV